MAKQTKKTIEELVNEPHNPPKQDVRLGDLTPEYIAWYASTHNKVEFHKKYIKVRHRIPQDLQHYFVH